MGSQLSQVRKTSDPQIGFKIIKVLKTYRNSVVNTLRIQPSGKMLATGDDSGNLVFFDLTMQNVNPLQSRHLLPEQGGISDICWLEDNLIAVGTKRGKIIIYSSHNNAGRFTRICDIDAHGDGVSQVAVDGMAFARTTRCLASVAEGKIGIKLWNINADGMITEQPTGNQLPEFAMPRFIAFANNGAEIVVGYLEQAIIKRFALHPWQQLERISLYQKSLEDAVPTKEGSSEMYLGNAVILPRTKQLAVFNLHSGLDIYDYPDLHGRKAVRFNVDAETAQGIAVLKSGSFLASPTKSSGINIIDCNASVVGVLRFKNRTSFYAVDGSSIPTQQREILVGAYTEKNETHIAVWQYKPPGKRSHTTAGVLNYNSFTRHLIMGIIVYLLCSFIQHLIATIASYDMTDIFATIRSVSRAALTSVHVEEGAER